MGILLARVERAVLAIDGGPPRWTVRGRGDPTITTERLYGIVADIVGSWGSRFLTFDDYRSEA